VRASAEAAPKKRLVDDLKRRIRALGGTPAKAQIDMPPIAKREYEARKRWVEKLAKEHDKPAPKPEDVVGAWRNGRTGARLHLRADGRAEGEIGGKQARAWEILAPSKQIQVDLSDGHKVWFNLAGSTLKRGQYEYWSRIDEGAGPDQLVGEWTGKEVTLSRAVLGGRHLKLNADGTATLHQGGGKYDPVYIGRWKLELGVVTLSWRPHPRRGYPGCASLEYHDGHLWGGQFSFTRKGAK